MFKSSTIPTAVAARTAAASVSAPADKTLLRFFTAGSVDDGKSTLIGRLLYDANVLPSEQRRSVETAQGNANATQLAELTDGLKAEREQGITIDVAYRYFQYGGRAFILADSPGHAAYTRNMITAASTASLGVLLVDARQALAGGIKHPPQLSEQSKRHAIISALLRVPALIVCINKMDLVDYAETAFINIKAALQEFLRPFAFTTLDFLPCSALRGEGIVRPAKNTMPWYNGHTLLARLVNFTMPAETAVPHTRFPIQLVLKTQPEPSTGRSVRHYAGSLLSGKLSCGQRVKLLPSGSTAVIATLHNGTQAFTELTAPSAATLTLHDETTASTQAHTAVAAARGELITDTATAPRVVTTFTAVVCALSQHALRTGHVYLFKHGTQTLQARLDALSSQLNIHNGIEEPAPKELKMNSIGRVRLLLSAPYPLETYAENKPMGRFILISLQDQQTVAAGLCLSLHESTASA